MSRVVASFIALALTYCAWEVTQLRAQDAGVSATDAAFDSLSVALRVTANTNRNTFHEFWDPSAGIELEASTPFYLGTVELGLHLTRFSGNSEVRPDFSFWYPYLGWGLGWSPRERLLWHNSAHVGIAFMRFADVSGNADERELGVDLSSRLTVNVAGPWAVDLGARYLVVFTHERLRYVFLLAGARYTLATPGWLKEFLR